MEPTNTTIDQLRKQQFELCEQIAALEETVVSSSTPGIREFRMTRLRQLQELYEELSERLRRLELSHEPAADAYLLGTAFREATLVAQGTFRT